MQKKKLMQIVKAAKYNFDRVAKTTKEIQQKLRKKQKSGEFNCEIDTTIDDE